MGFITIKKRHTAIGHFERQGIVPYGEPIKPKTDFKAKVLNAGHNIKAGLHAAHETIEKTQHSAGFKSFKNYLRERNEYYQKEFDADREHIGRTKVRR